MISMKAAALEAYGITLRYPGASGPVIEDLNLAVSPGEIVAVLGPSGIGKSTLLRVLAGLRRPDLGNVWVGGERLDGVHPRAALAFQDPGLLPWLTLEKNVAFGLDFKRQPSLTADERRRRVDAAIAETGLDRARKLHPHELSGGMAQRAALARCLAREPEVLLLDEPFGALDEVTRASMQQLLLRVNTDLGVAIVLITHDIDEALQVADRVVLLGGGPAREIGHWLVDVPKPRDDALATLGPLRTEILSKLRATLRKR
jgi:NitT/TauT family transport system ATP-binding protein